jgi:hypothetical protein
MKTAITMLWRTFGAFLITCACSPALGANPSPHLREVDNLKLLLIEALEAPDGKAKAFLTGPAIEMANKYFDAHGKLAAVVTREKRYRQPGCGRLKVVLHQMGVLDPITKERKTRASVYGMDYCTTGKAPVDKTEV